MTAWVYCAVSSSKQEDTIDDQLAWARKVARENGWEIRREFHGVSSGRDGTRKLLEQLLAELRNTAKAERPQRVLTIRIERLGRGMAIEAIAALAQIHKLGVTLHTRVDGDITLHSVEDALKPIFNLVAGAFENRDRRDKSIEMHARKRALSEVQGLPPYGFVIIDKHLAPYEPEAAFLREIYDLRARGWSYGKLSAYAREHAPAKRRKDGSLQPLRWATTTLTQMLANREYRGAVIDERLWDDVLSMRRAKPIIERRARNPWPLRGALRCVCGLAVSGRVSGAGAYRKRYYVCVDVAAHGGYPGHDALKIEDQFTALLRRLAGDPDLLRDYRDRVDDEPLRAQRATFERDREAIATRRGRIWRLAEDDRIPADELATRLRELKVEIDRVDAVITEIDRRIAQAASARHMWGGITETLQRAAECWRTAPLPLQQEVANAVAPLAGGLWVDPERKNELLTGAGETVQKADDGITKKFIESIGG
jgi:DNA invertase Pin-like site-specific DNA recombinase